MRITFWGAAGTVTGSRFVVDTLGWRLLVDCGLFQGIKTIRQRNWEPFPVDPASIDAVIVTHAHIDHTGYLPALVRDGFRGQIWCTPATGELCRILLPDAAHIQEEDARHANFKHSSKHHPALPLYTTDDAERALGQLRPQPVHEAFAPVSGVEAVFSPVGHILGASCVRLSDGVTSVTFTGDVGRPVDPVMRAPEPPLAADYIVTESTYGNRSHGTTDPLAELEEVAVRTLRRGGSLLIPVFAVGRAQTILHLLSQLRAQDRIPEVPTYLNSPMAVHATEMFCAHPNEHRLDDDECKAMCDGVELVRTADESKEISSRTGPQIVLAASGMATGGRVLHHLERLAPDRHNTILFVGFQAAGTRGEAMLAGAPNIKLYGSYVPVRAEIARIDSLSAHADAAELTTWLGTCPTAPRRAYIVHGEPAAADALRRGLRDALGWETHVPGHGEAVEL
ncbi:MAG TPA: MBL fold metallo-hydrolase [Acidimicrobiales bacterium]|nr:MBL fold metallo-hydrolase [Acidimicrobiales bacterium]